MPHDAPPAATRSARPESLLRYAAAQATATARVATTAAAVDHAIARARAGGLGGRLRSGSPGTLVAAHAARSRAVAGTTTAVGLRFALAGGTLGVAAVLRPFAGLDDEQVVALVSAALRLPDDPDGPVRSSATDPDAVAALVTLLGPEQLGRLAADHPLLVGPTDGMPVELRYTANRILLARAGTAFDEQGESERAATVRALLAEGRQILFFDPSGDGRVAEVVGDLATAAQVAVVVPGMSNELTNFANTLDKAVAIHDAAGAGTAVVAWLGYDSPGVVTVPLDAAAVAGATDLVRLLDGLPDTPLRTVIGHSYGTVVTAEALRRGLDVDQVVVTGSPGMLEARAGDLAPATPIWVGRAPFDAVSWTENFGRDPSDPRFGATRFETGDDLWWHSSYFAPGSESLDNIVRIVTGRTDEVTTIEPNPVEVAIGVVDDLAGIAQLPVDLGQSAAHEAVGAASRAVDAVEALLPDPAADAVDAVQDVTGVLLEYPDRLLDLGQRLTSPDLVGDVALDAYEVVHDCVDDLLSALPGR